MQSAPGAQTVIDGRRYLYFAGTGYLGLQGHPALAEAACEAMRRYGIHPATTRTTFGTSPPVAEVERRASRFLGAEDALYLVSGYAGNFALAAALSPAVELAFIDETAHDCLREATRWLDGLRRPPITFRHRDAGHLAELMQEHVGPAERPLVMTDGLFPISGRLAPLGDYLAIAGRHDGAMLLVDDAHGIAVLGPRGRGTLELAGVPSERINRGLEERAGGPAVFHSTTLSKAVGGHGGLIAGRRAFLERVRSASGWFRGASSPSVPVAAATAKGLEIIEGDPSLRAGWLRTWPTLRSRLAKLGLDLDISPSPVIGFALDTAERMQAVHERLMEAGIVIANVRNYAGAGPSGMLRIAVFATHTPAMIERLADELGRAI